MGRGTVSAKTGQSKANWDVGHTKLWAPRWNINTHEVFRMVHSAWQALDICYFNWSMLTQFKSTPWASLVAQWLRLCLPMQGTRVWALLWEDPTCRRATKPVHHNYWACALEPTSHNYWAHMPHLLKPACLEPVLCNKRSHHNEKPAHRNEE